MRINKQKSILRNVVLGCIATLVISQWMGCARKANFLNSEVVPAARGSVKVKKDRNKNYTLDVSLYNLAEPERLTPSKKTYIVWIVGDDNLVKNVGQIKTSSGFLSKTLKGSFNTVSTTKPIRVLITAEDDLGVQNPGTVIVLTTNNF